MVSHSLAQGRVINTKWRGKQKVKTSNKNITWSLIRPGHIWRGRVFYFPFSWKLLLLIVVKKSRRLNIFVGGNVLPFTIFWFYFFHWNKKNCIQVLYFGRTVAICVSSPHPLFRRGKKIRDGREKRRWDLKMKVSSDISIPIKIGTFFCFPFWSKWKKQ